MPLVPSSSMKSRLQLFRLSGLKLVYRESFASSILCNGYFLVSSTSTWNPWSSASPDRLSGLQLTYMNSLTYSSSIWMSTPSSRLYGSSTWIPWPPARLYWFTGLLLVHIDSLALSMSIWIPWPSARLYGSQGFQFFIRSFTAFQAYKSSKIMINNYRSSI